MSIAKLVAVAGVAVALSAPVAAGAQTASDYPGGPPPQVLSENVAREVPTQVLGESVSRGGVAVAGEGLAVTGADLAGLVAMGLGAVATGTILVRRSRNRPA